MPGRFHLSKWYFDCVSADGDAVIAYRAELAYGALQIAYASLLRYSDAAGASSSASLRASEPPRVATGEVAWDVAPLAFSGVWRGATSTTAHTIFSSDAGEVTWTCPLPRAATEVRVGTAPTLRGLGYVEHLSLTLPPWRLPIDELRWGRFIADDGSLVWIAWMGPTSTKFVLADGRTLTEGIVDEHGVYVPPAELTLAMSDRQVLREGAIGATALSVLPAAVRKNFPGRIFGLDERKWRARGRLMRRGGRTSTGWVIYEVVRWP